MLMKLMNYLSRKEIGAVKFFTFDGYYYDIVLGGSIIFDFPLGRILEYQGKKYCLYLAKTDFGDSYNWKTKLYGVEFDEFANINEKFKSYINRTKVIIKEDTNRQSILWREITKRR